MLKLNDSNIIVGEIKQLLKSYNLPKIPVIRPGILLVKGNYYILENNIVIATKTSFVSEDNLAANTVVKSGFIPNTEIRNLTKNYILNSIVYDSYCHTYLGNYLRFIRDYYNLDLMSMYNCFGATAVGDLNFVHSYDQDSGSYITDFITDLSNTYTIYNIPIKLNQKYTIAIDSDEQIELIACVFADNQIVREYKNGMDTLQNMYNLTYRKISSTSFSKPFLFDGIFEKDLIADEESMTIGDALATALKQKDNLNLFIKIPSKNTSSLVVLEGDYVSSAEFTFNKESSKNVANLPLNYQASVPNWKRPEYEYVSTHQLLNLNSSTHFLVADRLIEYLSDNVITPLDEISYNISRVQKKLVTAVERPGFSGMIVRRKIDSKNDIYYGIWSDKDRKAIYEDACRIGLINKEPDILGYVDCPTEKSVIGDYEYSEYSEVN